MQYTIEINHSNKSVEIRDNDDNKLHWASLAFNHSTGFPELNVSSYIDPASYAEPMQEMVQDTQDELVNILRAIYPLYGDGFADDY